MSYLQASPGTGTGGGGAFTSITGTPTEVAYFDALGNGTSDSLFTRNSDQETRAFSQFDGFLMGFQSVIDPLGFFVTGIQAIADDDSSAGAIGLISSTGGVGFPEGVTKIESFEGVFGEYAAITFGGGFDSEWVFSTNDNVLKETTDTYSSRKTYSNDTYTQNTVSRMDESEIGIAYGESGTGVFSNVYETSAYLQDIQGSKSRAKLGRSDRVQSQTGTFVTTPSFTGTGLDDIVISGAYIGTESAEYEVIIQGTGQQLIFSGGMDVGDQFTVGATVTGSVSGATGVVVWGGANNCWVKTITGTFSTSDVLTGSDGNESTVITTLGSINEIYTTQLTINGISRELRARNVSLSPQNAGQGMTVAFGSLTGHDEDDEWTFTAGITWATRQEVPANIWTVANNLSVDIFEIALPEDTMASGFLEWSVNATDGTDFQVRTVRRAWTAVNKGGVITTDVGLASGGVSVSAGTLNSGLIATAGTDKVTLSVDAVSSLTDPAIDILAQITNNSKQSITILY